MSDASYVQKTAQNVHRFAQAQGGHVTRAQLEASGLAPRTIADWIAGGRLIRVYRGVYAVGHLQRNPVNHAHAALLAGGEHSALAGACALVLWGVWKRWPREHEIVIAGNRRPSGLIVHQSRTLLRRDVVVLEGLRVTSAARTMLDTAPRLSEPRRTRAVNDLRLRGLLGNDELEDVVSRNAWHAGAPLLRPLIETAQREPTRSELEDVFLQLLHDHGLPIPEINVHVCGYRVDAYFPDHRLIVELDGWATHRTRQAFARDRRQDADILATAGIPTVRLTYEEVVGGELSRLQALIDRCGVRPAAPQWG